jgi:uncharacterized phage protein (TIGR01671 family)
MREIKFRAWHKKQKKMVIVLAITFSTNYLHYAYDNTWNLKYGKSYWSDISNFEIMQFTGIRDKYDKEIYEGDIVKYDNYLYVVSWIDKLAGFRGVNIERERSDLFLDLVSVTPEVIGNVYENPELLGQQEGDDNNE